MYGATGASTYVLTHTNTTNSTIKGTLDTWYTKHLSSYSNLFAQDAGFCNDRSIASSANTWVSGDTALGYGTNVTYYGASRRVYTNSPQFACPNEEDDLFTLTTSSKGNKKLANPIGLLSVDEVVYAGGSADESNSNYYLANNDNWWTMSPRVFDVNAGGWRVTVGKVSADVVDGSSDVRPAINLASTVEILDNGADGTIDKPYVIKTN